MSRKCIGVFDSGLGGISVLNRCIECLPNEDFLYLADKVNAPYGDKSTEDIIEMTDRVIKYFVSRDVKAVVIACNTATSAAVEYVRYKYSIPIVGTEPAIKMANHVDNEDNLTLVLATDSTVMSSRFKSRIKEYGESKYHVVGCGGLVELIETSSSDEINEYLRDKLAGIDLKRIDSVVLGCTHYPFIRENLRGFLGENITFYDGGKGVAKRLKNILSDRDLLSDKKQQGSVEIKNTYNSRYNEILESYLDKN